MLSNPDNNKIYIHDYYQEILQTLFNHYGYFWSENIPVSIYNKYATFNVIFFQENNCFSIE